MEGLNFGFPSPFKTNSFYEGADPGDGCWGALTPGAEFHHTKCTIQITFKHQSIIGSPPLGAILYPALLCIGKAVLYPTVVHV